MGRDRIRAEGGFTGRAPWGYEITGPKYAKTIVPTEEGRRLVPEIYARVIKGESLATIGEWLEAETGREWWPRTIGTMIRNPVYRGAQHDAAGRVIYRCEALVDAATCAAARARRWTAGRSAGTPTPPPARCCPGCSTARAARTARCTG